MSNTRVTVFLSVCLSRLPFLKAYTFAVARRVMMTVRIKFVIAPLAGVLVGLVLVCLYETLLSFVTDRQQSNDVRQLSVVGLHSTEPPSTGTTDKRSVELDCSQHTAAQKAVIAQLTKQRDELSHQLNELQVSCV